VGGGRRPQQIESGCRALNLGEVIIVDADGKPVGRAQAGEVIRPAGPLLAGGRSAAGAFRIRQTAPVRVAFLPVHRHGTTMRLPPFGDFACALCRRLSPSPLSSPPSGCTWVHMAPGASAVRVIPPARPTGCEQRGEVAVSVKARSASTSATRCACREELETLARNEGPALQADTLQAAGRAARRRAAFRGLPLRR
jgi:hypothetical protein